MLYYVSVGEQEHENKGRGFIGSPPQPIITSLTGESRRLFATRILRFLAETTQGLVLVRSSDIGSMDRVPPGVRDSQVQSQPSCVRKAFITYMPNVCYFPANMEDSSLSYSEMGEKMTCS